MMIKIVSDFYSRSVMYFKVILLGVISIKWCIVLAFIFGDWTYLSSLPDLYLCPSLLSSLLCATAR